MMSLGGLSLALFPREKLSWDMGRSRGAAQGAEPGLGVKQGGAHLAIGVMSVGVSAWPC